jgi:hypothetical protein
MLRQIEIPEAIFDEGNSQQILQLAYLQALALEKTLELMDNKDVTIFGKPLKQKELKVKLTQLKPILESFYLKFNQYGNSDSSIHLIDAVNNCQELFKSMCTVGIDSLSTIGACISLRHFKRPLWNTLTTNIFKSDLISKEV